MAGDAEAAGIDMVWQSTFIVMADGFFACLVASTFCMCVPIVAVGAVIVDAGATLFPPILFGWHFLHDTHCLRQSV